MTYKIFIACLSVLLFLPILPSTLLYAQEESATTLDIVQLDLAHLEKNADFAKWEGEGPAGWSLKELTARATGESNEGKAILEIGSETGQGVFCQISSDVAKVMRSGDTINAEFLLRNVSENVAEIYIGIESDETEKPVWTTISQMLPATEDWRVVRFSWMLDKTQASKDGHFLRVVYGIRFKSSPSPKPIEICAPRFSLINAGL